MAANGPLKWHGGKSYLARHIHAAAPTNGYTHRNYVFAGGLGELWGWECEGISETANDINRGLTNFWSVLGDEWQFEKLRDALSRTPFAEEIWKRQQQRNGILLEWPDWRAAVAFFVTNRQSRQGLGKDYATPTTRTRRGMNENVSAWLSAVEGLPEWHERFKRVEVRNMDCCDFIRKYDHEQALFYCDPPYLHDTRSSTGEYQHEMTPHDHNVLLHTLADIKGRFILSGYPHPLYDDQARMSGWKRIDIEIDNKASSKREKEKKTECLWMNY